MGLFSYFRNKKLKKADRLLLEGRPSEAEEIYRSLIAKHPLAASKLAGYYYSLSSSADVNNDISLFKKTVELKSQAGIICDVSAYDPIMSSYVEHIKERARKCFELGSYDSCYALTSVLQETNTGSTEVSVLRAEAKKELLFKDIKTTKATEGSFMSLISTFKNEWAICKNVSRAQKSALQFCKNLIDSKRYYASNLVLSIIRNNDLDSECLDNVVHIVKGHDQEVSPKMVKTIVSSYGKHIALREGISVKEAISIFEDCWRVSNNADVAMDILKNAKDTSLRDALIGVIIQNHAQYLSSSSLKKDFFKWLYDAFDGEESLKLLEKFHSLGYNVEDYYTQKTHLWTSGMPDEERLPHLIHSNSLFPNTSFIIDDILSCAKHYLDNDENEKAISVSDIILDECEDAFLIKAKALCKIANKEQNADHKLELLNQSQSTLSSYHGADVEEIENNISEALIQTANLYYSEGNKDKAYFVLTELSKKGVEKAVSTIASFRLSEVQALKNKKEKLDAASAAIEELRAFGISSLVENQDYQALWDEKIAAQIFESKGLDNQSAVTLLGALLKDICSVGFNADVLKNKKAKIIKQLVERKYLIARDYELAGNLVEASSLYKAINGLEAKRTPTLSALRFIICKLKSQSSVDVLEHRDRIYTILRNAPSAFKSEKEDIAYRFALILLKAGEDKEAKSVLTEFLPNEEYLKKACEQGDMIKALAKLDDFNEKLESVKKLTLSSNDAIYFINHMLEYADTIRPVLDIPRSTLTKYRNKLKNYAIFKLFDEGRYDIAFEKMVKVHQDYLGDYTALRNIALVCLNMAETKQINSTNYKEVIAIWLTAIYQVRLFVKSLDYTSWDDPFTFSLYEAYGHFDGDTIGDLPDNVNFCDMDDSCIVYIKDVQRALLDRFEAAISDTQEYHEFYTSQKETMDSFIALNLDIKCRLVAPYLAHKNNVVFQEISNALEQDRSCEYDNWEDVLSVGALYQMPQTIYTNYSDAKSYYSDCIDTINSVNNSKVGSAFASSKIDLIKRFKKLSSALISYTNSKISALSANNKTEFKNNYKFYHTICNSLKNSTLSYVFSNFVMQYVVGKVNDNSMKKSEAAEYILSIFLLDKSNTRVKENLTTLFEMLARESSSDSTKATSMILEKTKTFDSSFYRQLNGVYEEAKIGKELNDIVDKFSKKSITESTALQKVYSLYNSHPNDDNICEVLSQLCVACIMKYIVNQEYGGSSIKTVLNGLKNNMSPTFKKHRRHFKDMHDTIWNKLDLESQMLIEGSLPPWLSGGKSLNDSGIALKEGLGYMKSLGGFSTSSSSLFGSYPFG